MSISYIIYHTCKTNTATELLTEAKALGTAAKTAMAMVVVETKRSFIVKFSMCRLLLLLL